jgi:hypothetical protein
MNQLVIYDENRVPTLVKNPHADALLGWLDQLGSPRVATVVIVTSVGRMSVDIHGDKLILAFSDADRAIIRRNEVVSQQIAAETALFFLENQGLPAGRAAVMPPAHTSAGRTAMHGLTPLLSTR